MAFPSVKSFISINLPSGQTQESFHYIFENVGDEIPLHAHDFFHSTLCAFGSCEVFNSQGKTLRIDAGSYVEFPAGKEHGLRALTPGMILINTNEPK